MLIFDANANPHNTPESQGLRWRYTASTKNNATNAAKEERRQGPRRDQAPRGAHRDPGAGPHRNNLAEKKGGDHHSPMKHSKRRMLGAMVKAGGIPPNCSRPASRRTTSSR